MASTAADAGPDASAQPSAPAAASAAPPLSAWRQKATKLAAKQAALLQRSQALLPADAPWRVVVSNAGRRGVATRDLPHGITLVHERAAGWVVLREHAETTCAYCTRTIRTPGQPQSDGRVVRCRGGCLVTCYCSWACQGLAEPLHRLVCPILSRVEDVAQEASCSVDMLALVTALVAGLWLEQHRETGKGVDKEQANKHFEEAEEMGLAQGRWSDVQDLVSHAEKASPAWLASITSGMQAMARVFHQCKLKGVEGLQAPDVPTLVRLCCRINSNSHSIFDNFSNSNSVVGLGLFVATSILNHSCYPNSIFSCGSDGCMVVRTIRPVAQGEELTVPYCDLYLPRRDRMKELYTDKHFVCACERCRAEEKGQITIPFPAAAAAPASSTSDHDSSSANKSGIDAARINAWLSVGAIFCPQCPQRAREKERAQLEKDLLQDEKKGKKKKKAKAGAPAASGDASTPASAAATPSTAPAASSTKSPPADPADSDFTLSPAARQCGLLVWRGGIDEIRAELAASAPGASAPPPAPRNWVCTRKECGAKYTLAEVDALLEEVHSRFVEAATLKADPDNGPAALEAYEHLLHLSLQLAPPEHVLSMLTLLPLLNLSLHHHRLDLADVTLCRLLALMERVFPAALPEPSDFAVQLAEVRLQVAEQCMEQVAEQCMEQTGGRDIANCMRSLRDAKKLYQRALDVRSVACGPQHPRTTEISVPGKFGFLVAPTQRGATEVIQLPARWQETPVEPVSVNSAKEAARTREEGGSGTRPHATPAVEAAPAAALAAAGDAAE